MIIFQQEIIFHVSLHQGSSSSPPINPSNPSVSITRIHQVGRIYRNVSDCSKAKLQFPTARLFPLNLHLKAARMAQGATYFLCSDIWTSTVETIVKNINNYFKSFSPDKRQMTWNIFILHLPSWKWVMLSFCHKIYFPTAKTYFLF